MLKPLYITDLDGTLLRSDLKLSDYTRTVMNRAIHEGVNLTYCTARTYTAARSLLSGIQFRLPAILLNGAIMVDPTEHKPIICNNLAFEIAEDIIDKGKKYNLLPIVLNYDNIQETVMYFGLQNQAQCNLIKQLKAWHHPVSQQSRLMPSDTLLNLFFIAPYEQLLPFQEWIDSTYRDSVDVLIFEDSYNKGFFNLQISNPRGNKGLMVQELAAFLGIPLSATTVFGDHVNDLSMFAVAGRKIAVGNAHESVMQIADESILSNDEDGVAKYLGELIS
ncbi:HAD family hydrolase [Paenibacillus woosongensis]|uniref:Haloacid dehalogenase n=1 Tax=Paenibacillus woosongensis TaxID=307580 RepID=A0ABQ4MQK9_9BACL|nr:HAD family hydrolase [Paenibacillus woosongensis]GIP58277.1 haloacid dehalogenase [Paenibacillus woosongensis]